MGCVCVTGSTAWPPSCESCEFLRKTWTLSFICCCFQEAACWRGRRLQRRCCTADTDQRRHQDQDQFWSAGSVSAKCFKVQILQFTLDCQKSPSEKKSTQVKVSSCRWSTAGLSAPCSYQYCTECSLCKIFICNVSVLPPGGWRAENTHFKLFPCRPQRGNDELIPQKTGEIHEVSVSH